MTGPAFDALDAALADLLAVADLAGDVTLPTPCAGWDVRRLLEHLIGWQRVFAACADGVPPPFADGSPAYRAPERPVPDLHASATALAAALRRRGDGPVTLPFRGCTPVAAHVDELVAETVLHGWDLAVAAGVPFGPAADVVAVADRGLTLLLGEPFAPVAFAAARDGGAPGLDALLARSGR